MASASDPEQDQRDLSLTSRPGEVYIRLPTDELYVRLLEIEPGDRDTPIECTLSIHKLDEAPPYSAISYEWGSATAQAAIKIDGISINVGVNCHYSSWQVRSLALAQHYWIDALCINQEDLEEKGSQVQQMGTIFETAEQVLACIGPHSDDTFAFFEKMRMLPLENGTAFGETCHEWMQSHPPKEMMDFFAAAIKFVNRSYWSRLWIVQEILVAQEVLIICGLETLEWSWLGILFHSDFATAIDDLSCSLRLRDRWLNIGEVNLYPVSDVSGHLIYSVLQSLTEARLSDIHPGRWSIGTLLTEYGGQQCADPPDRVYGFLHLIRKRWDPNERIIAD